MKTIVHHLTGNANVKAALAGFREADLLAAFYVTIAAFPSSWLDRMGSVNAFAEIRRRRFDKTLKPFVKTWPWMEAGRILSPKAGFNSLTKKETAPFFVDAVVQNLDRHVASHLEKMAAKGSQAVYGYEDTAILSFQEAKRIGLKCLYDLPIGYWRAAHRIFKQEEERWPQWASTLIGLQDASKKLQRKDDELSLADAVFVASSFTKKTLDDYAGPLAPVTVIPYGFPPVFGQRSYATKSRFQPLRVLFVGSLTQRKGIADLFAAAATLGRHVELTVVGTKPHDNCAALNVELRKHRWIPSLSHDGVLQLMREHDVLVFPSLFEGFGLVITEAMSQGTPVITTDRTAGPDLITHNENGWLIEAGSTQALQAALENLLYKPDILADAGQAAITTAAQRPWNCYGTELAAAVRSFLTSASVQKNLAA